MRTLWGICEQLEQRFVTFHQNWLISRPQQWLQQTSEIDSFQDPCVLHQNWLLSRPLCFTLELTPFKTTTVTYSANCQKSTPFKTLTLCIILDSFQDPYILHPNWTHYRIPSSELYQTQPNSVISRPSYWFTTVFQSPWETTCKISMGDFLHPKLFKTPYTVNFRLFHETKEEDTSHASNQHISTPRCNMFYIGHRNIHQNQFLSRPQKLHINHSQQYPSKDTISSTPTQDKDTITVHTTHLYILVSDFKLLKSTLCPLRTRFSLPKSNRSHKDILYHLVWYKYQSQC